MKKINIAIADDNEIFRKGVMKIMEAHDDVNIAIEAINGLDLISKLNHVKVDVILMEYNMKHMTTIEVLIELKNKKVQSKILILTNHKIKHDIVNLLYSRVSAYLLKENSNDIYSAIISCHSKGFYLNELCYTSLLDNLYKQHDINSKVDKTFYTLNTFDIEIIKLVCDGKTSTEIGKIYKKSKSSIDKTRAEIN